MPKIRSDFDDEEQTVVDGEHITPVDLPRCTECGAVVFFDSFDEPAQALAFGLFGSKTCIRARDGHFWYCSDLRKSVFLHRK